MMTISERLTVDLKAAMLSGDKTLATTLRGLKSTILYAEVAAGKRDEGLDDTAIIELFAKEAKKRQESADLFTQGGNAEKAAAELEEKKVIERYLPAQMSDKELDQVVSACAQEFTDLTASDMGKLIGKVKAKVGASADGARIAAAVKKVLQ